MTVHAPIPTKPETDALDVLIVGAGISGIDAARYLLTERPGTSFALIDRQDDIGGTWKTHKFPGIRSDSDLFTFGFSWKPWTGAEMATADEILKYLNEAVDDLNLRPRICFGRDMTAADWDEEAQLWRLTVQKGETEERISARFLWMCQGYYRHETPYIPDYPGRETFQGPVIHPQTWPEDLDVAGKRVTVIGSGATAATLVPALARQGAQVTMLQRSPTFYFPSPKEHDLAQMLRPLDLPDEWFHEIMRRRYLADQLETQRRAKVEPEALAKDLIALAEAGLQGALPVDPHFTPRYRVWRQRLARVPEGDLYQAIREGRATVVTDEIERFDETGIALKSGERVDADVIVSATGFNMSVMGDAAFTVGGRPVDWASTVAYRGMMFSGVPNLVWVFGYIRTSWTMRADMVCAWVCRLLAEMDGRGASSVTPELGEAFADMALKPFIDPENFNAGYVMRALDIMPRQGDRDPWRHTQDYFEDKDVLPHASFDDGALRFHAPALLEKTA